MCPSQPTTSLRCLAQCCFGKEPSAWPRPPARGRLALVGPLAVPWWLLFPVPQNAVSGVCPSRPPRPRRDSTGLPWYLTTLDRSQIWGDLLSLCSADVTLLPSAARLLSPFSAPRLTCRPFFHSFQPPTLTFHSRFVFCLPDLGPTFLTFSHRRRHSHSLSQPPTHRHSFHFARVC